MQAGLPRVPMCRLDVVADVGASAEEFAVNSAHAILHQYLFPKNGLDHSWPCVLS